MAPDRRPPTGIRGSIERFAAERAQAVRRSVGLIQPIARSRWPSTSAAATGELTAPAAGRLRVGDDDRRRQLAGDARRCRRARVRACGSSSVTSALGAATPPLTVDLDLVVANASLHWVPDHPRVLARWAAGPPLRWPDSQCRCRRTPTIRRTCWPSKVATLSRSWRHSARRPPPIQSPRTCSCRRTTRRCCTISGSPNRYVRLEVYGHVLRLDGGGGGLDARLHAHAVLQAPPARAARAIRRLPTGVALLARLGEHEPYFYPFKRILMWGRCRRSNA